MSGYDGLSVAVAAGDNRFETRNREPAGLGTRRVAFATALGEERPDVVFEVGRGGGGAGGGGVGRKTAAIWLGQA